MKCCFFLHIAFCILIAIIVLFSVNNKSVLIFFSDQNTVPVLFQLEVPSSWNTTKIIKAVEKLRLSYNSGSGLKIKAFSRDDLNLHVDVVKEVLRESGKFFTGITQLMTDILTTAKVKTDEVADVKINLRLPKSKGTQFYQLQNKYISTV